jgi:hypothetical protein
VNDTPRRRVLRRARLTTVGIVVTVAAGTAALTAVAANATSDAGGTATPGIDGSQVGSRDATTGLPGQPLSRSTHSGSGLVQAPSNSQPQGGTNAS